MNELLTKWLELKETERKAKEEREEVEASIYMTLKNEIPDDGSSTWNYENFKLNIKQNYSVTVDQKQAKMFPDLFKTKYELTWSQYKKSEAKNVLDNMVVVKSTKPTFTVEMK